MPWKLTLLHAQESHHAPSAMSPKGTCVSKELECANAATPWMLKDGTLLLAWTAGGSLMWAQSRDFGRTFTKAQELAHHEQTLDTGADARAQIVADDFGHVLIAYASFKDKLWNAQIHLLRSTDAGAHFSPSDALAKVSSERFPTLGLSADGRVYLAWVDKRMVQLQRAKGLNPKGGSIALAYSTDWAEHLSPVTIANKESCECCRIAMDASRPDLMVLAYRALFASSIRDHASQVFKPSSHKPELLEVQDAQRVSIDQWQTDVCPHHGPGVSVSSANTIHTVWFTQGQRRQGLFYARSEDRGTHFSAPMAMGDVEKNESRPQILAMDKAIWMVWKRFDGVHSQVMERHSLDDGLHWSVERRVAQTAGYSDHPLLLQHEGSIYLSWLTRMEGFQLLALNSAP